MGVVQLLQDLIHYGVGQVGDNGELHLAVGIGGAVQLLTASPLGLHPFYPQMPENGPAGWAVYRKHSCCWQHIGSSTPISLQTRVQDAHSEHLSLGVRN